MPSTIPWRIVQVALPFLIPSLLGAQAVRINDDSGVSRQEWPVIAMHPNGPAVICWQDDRDRDAAIYMQQFSRRGLPFLNNRRADDSPAGVYHGKADVAMDRHGQFTVVYSTEIGGEANVRFRQFYANGMAKGPSQLVTLSGGGSSPISPRISMSPSGSFVVVWSQDLARVFARVYSPDGEEMSDQIQINPAAEGDQFSPDVVMDESGDFMVVWVERRLISGRGVRRILGRLFDRDGVPKTGSFEVSNPAIDGNGDLIFPRVSRGITGQYLVTWINNSDQRVWGRLLDANGEFHSPPTILSQEATLITSSAIASHPEWNLFTYTWIGWHMSTSEIRYNLVIDGAISGLEGVRLTGGSHIASLDMAMANGFNAVFVWSDDPSGDFDIYALWQGKRMPMRTTAASGFDGMVPISWDPPYGFTGNRPYHIHRLNPDGSREVIATINPAERALPAQMLDYIDHDVVNGKTYQYAIQLDGEPDDQLVFVEASPSASPAHLYLCEWLDAPPTIDGDFQMLEWLRASYLFELTEIANPEADDHVYLIVKNDSTHLYLCVLDANDRFVDPGNTLGIVFDEDHDGQWETSLSLGEGMLTLTNGAKTFTPFVGRYPTDLQFSAPQVAQFIDFAVGLDTGAVVYECRIDLQNSPLNASPGDTIGFGLWIKDPGRFYAWGQGNAGEWPRGALWDAAETLGDLVLAGKPLTQGIPLGDRMAIQMEIADLFGDGQEELIVLSVPGDAFPVNGQVAIYQWEGERFTPLFDTEIIEGWPSTLRVADIDRDGRLDILFTCTDLKMLRNTGEGFELTDLINGELRSFVVLDLDHDGLSDIAVRDLNVLGNQIALYQQNEAGAFESVGGIEGSEDLVRLESLDCNRDGLTDLLCLGDGTNRVVVLHNDGVQWTASYEVTLLEAIYGLTVADFDQDGYDDFAVSGSKIRVYRNTHDGHFEEIYESDAGLSTFALHAASIDEDDLPELFVGRLGEVAFYDNRDGRDFEEIREKRLRTRSALLDIATGDLNHNGLMDVVFGSNPVEVLFDAALYYGLPTAVNSQQNDVPASFRLLQNYPNPFNPTTTIAFDVIQPTHVELKVFDMIGREITTLVNQEYQPGRYQVTFDGAHLPTGLYFYRIRMGDFEQTRRMVIVR